MAAVCASDGPSATTTRDVPTGAPRRSPSIARCTSAGQSVATMTTVAIPTGGSSSLEGTFREDPYLT